MLLGLPAIRDINRSEICDGDTFFPFLAGFNPWPGRVLIIPEGQGGRKVKYFDIRLISVD